MSRTDRSLTLATARMFLIPARWDIQHVRYQPTAILFAVNTADGVCYGADRLPPVPMALVSSCSSAVPSMGSTASRTWSASPLPTSSPL